MVHRGCQRATCSVHGDGGSGAAIVALAVLVWSLTRRLADAERKLADLTTLSRRLDDVRDDVTRGLALTRTHLADVAAGTPPPPT